MIDPDPNIVPSQEPFTIAICGGGIAGLALAIGLLRHNVSFHLYESAHAFTEVGAGIAFHPNSLRAMSLIDPKIRQGYDKRATSNGRGNKDVWMEFRAGMDCGVWKAEEEITTVKSGHGGNSTVHRAHFLDELVALVPSENVTFGKRVVEIEELATDGVRLHFADGSTAKASAAVGCDGVKSNLRRIVLDPEDEAAHPRFTGKYVYRAIVPMDEAVNLLGDELTQNGTVWLGHHGHVLTYPIQRGELLNIVACASQTDGGTWPDERWVMPIDRAKMDADFALWGDTVKKILGLMRQPDLWALFDYPPARTYFRGRICICGDAAHASAPHQGAGAGMALEDAYVLSHLLGAVRASSPSSAAAHIESAFRAFDHVRRPRTQRLVSTSREAGRLYELEAEGVGDDVEKFKANLEGRFRWIWEEDLEKHLEVAMGLLKEEGLV